MISILPPKRSDGKSSFRQAVDYAFGVSKSREECILHVGGQMLFLFGESLKKLEDDQTLSLQQKMKQLSNDAAVEMASLATVNVYSNDPLLHFALSWRENEFPTKEQADEAAHIALAELDLQDCQAVWSLQGDTDNLHLHVIANRIEPETGKAVHPNGGWTKVALERACRLIELKQGWEIETSGHLAEVTEDGQVVNRRFNRDKEKEPTTSHALKSLEAHTGNLSAVSLAKQEAVFIIKEAKSWSELHARLEEKDIHFKLSPQGNGAVLEVQGTHVKLSSVMSKENRLPQLITRLGEFQPSQTQSPQPQPLVPDQAQEFSVASQASGTATRPSKVTIAELLQGPVGKILKESKTWNELHESLAAEGVRLRTRRNAVTLSVFDLISREESHVSFPTSGTRQMLLNSLEKRLGPFKRYTDSKFQKLWAQAQTQASAPSPKAPHAL